MFDLNALYNATIMLPPEISKYEFFEVFLCHDIYFLIWKNIILMYLLGHRAIYFSVTKFYGDDLKLVQYSAPRYKL